DLKQVAMAVRADGPVVNRRARDDGLDMNEIERLVVRRIAVEMEQRQRSGGHAKIIGQTDDRENASAPWRCRRTHQIQIAQRPRRIDGAATDELERANER